jgi:hypothetical protein
MSKIKLCKDIVQGDTFKIKISHNPTKDLTGGSLIFTLKKREDSTTAVLSITHNVGDDTDDVAATGTAYITVTGTSSIDPGRYFGSIKRVTGTDTYTIIRSDKDNVDLVTVYKSLT